MNHEDQAEGLYDMWMLKHLDEKSYRDEDDGHLQWVLQKKWDRLPPPVYGPREEPTFRVDLWSDQIVEMWRASDLIGKYIAMRVDEEMMKDDGEASDSPVRG